MAGMDVNRPCRLEPKNAEGTQFLLEHGQEFHCHRMRSGDDCKALALLESPKGFRFWVGELDPRFTMYLEAPKEEKDTP